MADGKLEGLVIMGQYPAVGSPNGKLERTALSKLKWLVDYWAPYAPPPIPSAPQQG